ncbi:MAG: Gfo/Idh/MocA family oxidoreductase [Verrucomicrobiota bacterium]
MPSKTEPLLRWGILSTAQIARKNWKAIRNSGNATIVAVASRDEERSRRFIADCHHEAPLPVVPRALGSYEALLASPEVEAVYIPLPTGLRKEWVLRAAAAGKHVLCEKPCAVTVADLEQMIDACQRNQVQFMDGVMFMHSRRLQQIRQVLEDGTSVGDIRRISSAFSFCADEAFFEGNIRSNSALEPHGCLGDLGWYTIRLALWVLKGRMPQRVTGRILASAQGAHTAAAVPISFSGELLFEGGLSAGLYNSFITEHQQWAHVSGHKGYLQLTDFVAPFFGSEVGFEVNNVVHTVNGCDFNMEFHWRRFATAEYANSHPTAQETNLFRTFSKLVLSGERDQSWPELSLKTQRILNACYSSALADGAPVDQI